uniref:SFRICE_032341 n=1 Tax=Spodoptera frugiperda TaxID=7108 RepID=A0A2H1WKS9_SPOFR
MLLEEKKKKTIVTIELWARSQNIKIKSFRQLGPQSHEEVLKYRIVTRKERKKGCKCNCRARDLGFDSRVEQKYLLLGTFRFSENYSTESGNVPGSKYYNDVLYTIHVQFNALISITIACTTT